MADNSGTAIAGSGVVCLHWLLFTRLASLIQCLKKNQTSSKHVAQSVIPHAFFFFSFEGSLTAVRLTSKMLFYLLLFAPFITYCELFVPNGRIFIAAENVFLRRTMQT